MDKILSIIAVVIAIVALAFVVMNQPKVPTAQEIAAKVILPTPQVTPSNPAVEEMANDYLKDKKETTLKNDTAKLLVLEEMKTKDFKKEIMSVLNDEDQNVEDYKDIVEIYSISIEEVELNGEDATITVEFKVKFCNDGDEEDESEKAKFSAVFDVTGLVVDDSFEDSETELDTLELIKVYE